MEEHRIKIEQADAQDKAQQKYLINSYKLVCPCSAVRAVSMSVLQCGPRGFALVGMHVPVKFLLITISVYKVALQSRYVYNEQFVLNAALFFAPGP